MTDKTCHHWNAQREAQNTRHFLCPLYQLKSQANTRYLGSWIAPGWPRSWWCPPRPPRPACSPWPGSRLWSRCTSSLEMKKHEYFSKVICFQMFQGNLFFAHRRDSEESARCLGWLVPSHGCICPEKRVVRHICVTLKDDRNMVVYALEKETDDDCFVYELATISICQIYMPWKKESC